ncbi:MAG: hypothetical protein JWP58_620 [Hymenobacter sp.]|nr:hypothetical protein [Hymenobacter sp.]
MCVRPASRQHFGSRTRNRTYLGRSKARLRHPSGNIILLGFLRKFGATGDRRIVSSETRVWDQGSNPQFSNKAELETTRSNARLRHPNQAELAEVERATVAVAASRSATAPGGQPSSSSQWNYGRGSALLPGRAAKFYKSIFSISLSAEPPLSSALSTSNTLSDQPAMRATPVSGRTSRGTVPYPARSKR